MGAVLAYDAWITNLNLWVALASGLTPEVFASPQVQNATIQNLCPVIQERCVGADQQYSE
jgi:hypothetical protein